MLSSLLAASVVDATSCVSPAVLTAVFDVVHDACMNCDVQHASSLAQSTSMYIKLVYSVMVV